MSAPETLLQEAQQFLDHAETYLYDLSVEAQRADWICATYITEDSEALSAKAYSRLLAATVDLAKKAVRFETADLPEEMRRKTKLLRLSLPLIAPSDLRDGDELARIVTALQGTYGKGRYQPKGRPEPVPLQDLERVLSESHEPAELLDVWAGWHQIGRGMRRDFTRYVELANRGAREVGFPDLGAMWRSKYDMSPEAFAADVERLWNEVRPLYLELHTYVRRRLSELYGPEVVPPHGPIPAHLLGNMWAQSWESLFPLLAPKDVPTGPDLTDLLKRKTSDPKELVRYGERFFSSLGFDPLPPTFWERSMFSRPKDREVVCHASAWDVDFVDDLRIKMCIEVTGDDFRVIHHELGHNYYQRAYNQQPFLFRDSANDGFHEAVGDTIALSITPDYLTRIGLLEPGAEGSGDIALLLHRALEKVAFLPFGLLVDQWRWKVFAGEVGPDTYNQSWWELRTRYQGVAPPLARSEADFDPGAKYHIPSNVPYMRYFLAHILQFQFHRALARKIGWSGPLHACSIYGHPEAGERLNAMLLMGQSQPWPEALYALTGERKVDASAIRDYFAPLERWLHEQNVGATPGW